MKALQLPVVLEKLLAEARLSQREIARRCDFAASMVTKLADGQRCSPEVLSAIAGELGRSLGTPVAAYHLVTAHLHDEVVRAGFDPAHVVIKHVDGAVLSELDLSVETNAHLGLIAREAEKNADVAGILEDLAHMIVRHEAALAIAKAPIVPFMAAEERAPQPAPEKKPLPRGRSQQPTA